VAPEGYKNAKRLLGMAFSDVCFFFLLKNKQYRAIITINKSGVIVSCNNAARFLFGYPLGSMVGARVEKLMPGKVSHLASRCSHLHFFILLVS
jgi:PAS domain-containing protein